MTPLAPESGHPPSALASRTRWSSSASSQACGSRPVTLLDLGIDGSATVTLEVGEGSRRGSVPGAAVKGACAGFTPRVLAGVQLSA